MADIYQPGKPAFREYSVFFHDELEILNKEGQQPIDPHTGLVSSTTAISYRSEPMRNRMPHTHDPADSGEDVSMSSWVYGDPAPPILFAYVGDPVKIRLLHGGVKETHVFHLHNHQWRLEEDNPSSTIVDSITISPQECYTLDILYGAGSLNHVIGDVIFHCHLYPHFMEGMWTLWRIYDRLQDGTGELPDGGVTNKPTALEQANFVENAVPGALYMDTCPCHCDEKVKVFEIAMVQAKITYNRYGWHDPQGRFFVLKEELERHGGLECYIRKVEKQEIKVEPLVIRANAGDCIELRTINLLPEFIEGSPFQQRTRTDIVGHHLHLVKFDTIVSDGSANGWNNIAGALIIEEAGATFHNPQNGKELYSGTRAVIRRKNGTSFREFALFVHDFAFLFDRKGNPLNPPEVPGSHDDPGVMGINYRAEPMRERLRKKEDPAYLFSSFVHGDPATPIFETYPGDELMFRLIDGAHEEQHSFNVTGMSWRKEPADLKSPLAASQTLGVSEAFNLNVTHKYGAGDYLYYFGGIDDVWLGLWGIIRVHRRYRKHLKPLCQGKGMIQPLPPCPAKDDVVRRYEVVAVQKKLIYNRYGDHDPDGLVFAPLEDVDNVLSGKCMPKPLILRANAGDWIEVTLHNAWNPEHPIPYFSYPAVPLDKNHTIFGDMRNHRYHGLFGAVIVEPPGAQWYRILPEKKTALQSRQ